VVEPIGDVCERSRGSHWSGSEIDAKVNLQYYKVTLISNR